MMSDMKKVVRPTKVKGSKLRLIVVLCAIGLLIIVLLGWITVTRIQHDRAIAHERAQFAQADKDLDNVAAAIKTKFGAPANSQTDDSCTYTSNPNEFEKGDLVCNANRVLVYAVHDSSRAHELTDAVNKFLITSRTIYPKRASNDLDGTVPPIKILTQSFKDKSKLSCGLDYVFYDTDHLPLGFLIPDSTRLFSGLIVELTCGGVVKAPYYVIVH